MPRMLKLSAYFYPEQVASSHLTKDLDEAFVKAGFTIENYVPSPCRGVDEQTRKQYKSLRCEEFNDGKSIVYRFPMFAEGKNPILRALRYLLVNCIQYHKGTHAKDVDVIYGVSTPPTQGMLCGLVKRRLTKKYGHYVPFVFNLQDIFPDSLVNAKMTKEGSLIWKIGRRVEDYAYASADRIITISEDFKRNIMAKGVPEEKITVVSNWVNTENVYPVAREDNVLFDRFNLDRNLFYVCYSGNIGHSQNMDLLLRVAERVAQRTPDVGFVLIGEGAAKAEVCKQIDDRGIGNVSVFPFQDYSDIASVFSLGDIGLIISKPGVGRSSVPSKTWSIMAAGRPILASFDDCSELAEVIRSSSSGMVVNAGDEDGLVQAVITLEKDLNLRRTLGYNGIQYLQRHANKDSNVSRYVSVIEETLRG